MLFFFKVRLMISHSVFVSSTFLKSNFSERLSKLHFILICWSYCLAGRKEPEQRKFCSKQCEGLGEGGGGGGAFGLAALLKRNFPYPTFPRDFPSSCSFELLCAASSKILYRYNNL